MPDIRVRLNVAGFRLEYSGTLEFFERVVDPFLARLAPHSAAPEEVPAGPEVREPAATAPQGYRPPSYEFGQFVQKLGSEAAAPDRQIVAFAFFLWNYEKKDVVSEEEVEGCFRAIGLPPPSDAPTHYADLAGRLRFLAPGPSPRTWSLTSKGANYVKTRLLGAV